MNFGVFNIFWDKHPNHLPFLNLMESEHDSVDWNLEASISKLYSIFKTSSKEQLNDGIDLLLQSMDWRPHLVAIISLLSIAVAEREKFINKLWVRLVRGSWVSPQILVVLSIVDREFMTKAKRLLDEDFKVDFINLSVEETYILRDGVSTKLAKAKVIGAIHYLLGKTINREDDPEQGGAIAKAWSARLFESSANIRLQIQTA